MDEDPNTNFDWTTIVLSYIENDTTLRTTNENFTVLYCYRYSQVVIGLPFKKNINCSVFIWGETLILTVNLHGSKNYSIILLLSSTGLSISYGSVVYFRSVHSTSYSKGIVRLIRFNFCFHSLPVFKTEYESNRYLIYLLAIDRK